MIETLFAASIALFAYTFYVLVADQIASTHHLNDLLQPELNFESPDATSTSAAAAHVKVEISMDKPTIKSDKPSSKKPKTNSPTTDPANDVPVRVRIGLTAGSIWKYLSKTGDSSVTKLVKVLPEDDKIIQRSIGWLAQEGKITLETVNRTEMIGLKE
jgi:hypothetical protein